MIPFIDLKAQISRVEDDIQRRMNAVLKHGKFIMGPEVAELEGELAAFAGVKHCVTCSSGTDALLMSLMALGVGPGDAVFTTPFTFIATAEVISLLGATPVFTDVDAETYNLDPERLELAVQAVENRDAGLHPLPETALRGTGLTPKAVVPVDLYGLPADYRSINAVAERYGLVVLGDGAQSFGSMYHGARTAAAATAACTSFFPAKPLGCLGDGGAVFSDDEGFAEACASLRAHGKGGHKYDNVRTGLNARLDTIQAAALLSKLAIFPDELERRQRVAAMYGERLADLDDLRTPEVPEHAQSAWAQYTVRSSRRDEIQSALKEDGIPSVVYYPMPLHLQTAYADLRYAAGAFPVAEAMSGQVFSLPMHPYLEEETIDMVSSSLHRILS